MSEGTETSGFMDAVIIEKEEVTSAAAAVADDFIMEDEPRTDSSDDVLLDLDEKDTTTIHSDDDTPSTEAEAVQIVSIGTEEDAYAFSFHEDKLNKVLGKVPADDLVAVVSVVGAFRTGKSFLLNWFLRYLHTDRSAAASDSDDKMFDDFSKIGGGPSSGENNRSKVGFDWRGGSERNTTGIWMWSEPFQRTRPDGSTISVLLVDTQGMFDHETTMALTASIFGLSTLLSSYQIYNVVSLNGRHSV